jgi:hypothetical protein
LKAVKWYNIANTVVNKWWSAIGIFVKAGKMYTPARIAEKQTGVKEQI